MRGRIAILLVLLLLAAPLLSVPAAYAEEGFSSVAELNSRDVTIGVSPGSAGERAVRDELPQARLAFFDDKFMGYEAVAHGKIDAFVYDLRQMELSIENGQHGVHLLDDTLGEEVEIALGISPVSGIPDLEERVNRFLAGARADGTLDDMFRRWVVDGDETMPGIELPTNPSLHLIVGYIAVQDLTKMGDIVRSRTYEAFFPLIAVTVIYFLLEGGVGLLIRRLERRCDPKLRRPHIGIVVESAEDTGSVWMTVRYNGERLDVTQDGDRLSLAVLTSTESEMEYSFDAAHTLPNQLRLRIKGNGA